MISDYELSFLIGTYHSDFGKLKQTLNSILIQRDIRYQIVITDDGSVDNQFEDIKTFFHAKNFEDYILLPNADNRGTVQNIVDGLECCSADYVKLFSPGDFLASETAAREWLIHIKEKKASVSFCDAIYYTQDGGTVTCVREKANPQNTNWNETPVIPYLLYNDLGLGAATLCRKEKMEQYLSYIVGRVRYAEDNIYRIMAACGERFSYFHKPAIYYEFGTGVSTQKKSSWTSRLLLDMDKTDEIILKHMDPGQKETKMFILSVKARKNRRVPDRLAACLLVPGNLRFKLKRTFMPRMTPDALDMEYVQGLME